MSFLQRIHWRLQRDYFKYRFQRVVAHIESTAPVVKGEMDFTLLSMVHTRDVKSYLLAIKTFVLYANPQRVVVVCDPTITQDDRKTLCRHVPHIELYPSAEFAHAAIPKGGTWERLYAISVLSSNNYVIQLDADTITVGAIPEVASSIVESRGFVLGEESRQTFLELWQAAKSARLKLTPTPHIQTLSESVLDEVGLSREMLYVRGCSGFSGFPKTDDMKERLIDFSSRMSRKLSLESWARWGTEQVTSNFLVANSLGAQVLPFPKYGTPDKRCEESAFLHFIGSIRFVNSEYERVARGEIKALL